MTNAPTPAGMAELRDAITLILPLAKGYAAAHPVGSNQSYVDYVEALIAAQPSAGSEPVEFPYQKTFNAIAAAVTWKEGRSFGISVKAFQQAFNGDAAPVQPDSGGVVEVSDRRSLLARWLLNPALGEDEAIGAVAHHPAILAALAPVAAEGGERKVYHAMSMETRGPAEDARRVREFEDRFGKQAALRTEPTGGGEG